MPRRTDAMRPTAALDAQAPQHVGAILFALREVLALLFEVDLSYGTPAFRPSSAPLEHELAVAVAFTGDVEGWLALGMSRATAVALSGTLGRDQAEAYAAMAGDGLHEVANVMAGACAMTLHKRGFKLKLGHPTVALDEPLTVNWPNALVLEVPFQLPQGQIRACVSLKIRGAVPTTRTPTGSLVGSVGQRAAFGLQQGSGAA